MAHAAEIPEEAIPDEVGEAALDFLRWYVQRGRGVHPPPEWYAAWLETV